MSGPSNESRPSSPVEDQKTVQPDDSERERLLADSLAKPSTSTSLLTSTVSPVDLPERSAKETVNTSTPCQPGLSGSSHRGTSARSEPALLRIATQIREATMEECVRRAEVTGEPPEMERDGCELGSSFADHSVYAIGADGGGLLSELPQRANMVLQSARTALESSGNLRRDIRETLVGGLQSLYEMVLRLADSRARHLIERQKIEIAYEKRLVALEKKNAASLRESEGAAREAHLINRRLLEGITRDLADQRAILSHDVCETLEGLKTSRSGETDPELPRESTRRLRERDPEHMAAIRLALEDIKSAVFSGARGDDGLEREVLVAEVRKLRSYLKSTTTETLALNDRIKTADTGEDKISAMGTLLVGKIDELDSKIDAMGSELVLLAADSVTGKIAARIGETEKLLQTGTRELRRVTVEGFETIKDDITAAVAMQHAGLSLHEELTRGTDTGPHNREESSNNDWQMGGKTKRQKPGAGVVLDRNASEVRKGQPDRLPIRHTVVIESVDPRHTSDDVSKVVKSELDVIGMGIGVNSLRRGRGQKIIVGCDTPEDQRAFRDAVTGLNIGLSATAQPLKHPLLKLVGVSKDVPEEKILEAIVGQNKSLLKDLEGRDLQLKMLRRTKGRVSEVHNIILQVSPAMWGRLNNRKIRIGYQVVPAYDQSPAIQCFRCLEYGHVARNCKNEVACGYCTKAHDTRSCDGRDSGPICKNCKSSKRDCGHPAYSSQCPEWEKWDRLTRLTTDYGQC